MLDGKVVVLKRRAGANAAIALVDRADTDMRQLRHHTKNALQRIGALAATTPGLQATPEGRRLAAEIERRIMLTAHISDALFGLTRAPGALADRLTQLSQSLVDLLADPDQVIRTEVACEDDCPSDLHDIILRVTQELVSNAVKHGFQDRVIGRLRIQVARTWRGRSAESGRRRLGLWSPPLCTGRARRPGLGGSSAPCSSPSTACSRSVQMTG